MKRTIENLETGLRSMAIDEVSFDILSKQTNKTSEKNREKQEKMREYQEQDRQLAIIRVSRVIKGIDKSYVLCVVY